MSESILNLANVTILEVKMLWRIVRKKKNGYTLFSPGLQTRFNICIL